jgi:hypothetical protein
MKKIFTIYKPRDLILSWKVFPYIVIGIMSSLTAQGQNPTLSEGWYRIPYANGTEVKITRDYVDHGNNGGSQASANEGPMDMIAVNIVGTIVAAADGIVEEVFDGREDCGCHNTYALCQTNRVRILHPNGEESTYLHLAHNSVTVSEGQVVYAGQTIGIEGDVGYTCGNGRLANNLGGTCSAANQSAADPCGRHLHFTVRRGAKFLNPRICSPDVASDYFIFEDNDTYTAANCGTSTCQTPALNFNNKTFDGVMRAYPVQGGITTNNAVVIEDSDYTSIDFQAGTAIQLNAGFEAKAGSYFRASIRDCANNTSQDSDIR